MKKCYKCGKLLDDGCFYNRKDSTDGLYSYCIACCKIRDKEKYWNSREYMLIKSKKWAEENKAASLERSAIWYKKNRDKQRVRAKNKVLKLTDEYIKRVLVQRTSIDPDKISLDLIECKRLCIKIKREIKNAECK